MDINNEQFKLKYKKYKNKYKKYSNLEGGLFCTRYKHEIYRLKYDISKKNETLRYYEENIKIYEKRLELLQKKLRISPISLTKNKYKQYASQKGGLLCSKYKDEIEDLNELKNNLDEQINEYKGQIKKIRERINELYKKLIPPPIPLTIKRIPNEPRRPKPLKNLLEIKV